MLKLLKRKESCIILTGVFLPLCLLFQLVPMHYPGNGGNDAPSQGQGCEEDGAQHRWLHFESVLV